MVGCITEDSIYEVSPLLQKGKIVVRHYHVESFFFLFYIAATLYDTVSTNAIEVFSCQYFWDASEEECLNTSSPYFEDAQKFAANIGLITDCIGYAVPACLLFFIGPWSDVHGRKLLLIVPIVGFVITFGLFTWASTAVSKINPLFFILFTLPYVLSGGSIVLIFAGHCCICDLTPEQDRSVSLSMFHTTIFIASLGGSALAMLLIPYGYTVVFSTGTAFAMLATLNVNIFFKETVSSCNPSKESLKADKNIFQLEYLYELVRFYRKQTPKTRRTIILVTIGRLLYYFPNTGNSAIIYLFLQLKMHITLNEYALYSTFSMIVHVVGIIGGTWILTLKLKITDLFVLMIVSFLQVLATSFYVFSNNMWLIYISGLIGCMNNLFLPLYKSLLSKIVDSNDFGKVLAATEFSESVTGLVASFIYPILYQLTLLTFPAAVYVLSLLAYSAILFILMIVARMNGVSIQLKK